MGPAQAGGHAVERGLERLEEPPTHAFPRDRLGGPGGIGRGAFPRDDGAAGRARRACTGSGRSSSTVSDREAVERDRQRQPAPRRIEPQHSREPPPCRQSASQRDGPRPPASSAPTAYQANSPFRPTTTGSGAPGRSGARPAAAPTAARAPARRASAGRSSTVWIRSRHQWGVHGGSGGRATSLPFRLDPCGTPSPHAGTDLRRPAGRHYDPPASDAPLLSPSTSCEPMSYPVAPPARLLLLLALPMAPLAAQTAGRQRDVRGAPWRGHRRHRTLHPAGHQHRGRPRDPELPEHLAALHGGDRARMRRCR